MLKTVETPIDKQSDVKLREPTQLPKSRWTPVTIFSEELQIPEIALLSEAALAENRLPTEEDSTWTYFQPE